MWEQQQSFYKSHAIKTGQITIRRDFPLQIQEKDKQNAVLNMQNECIYFSAYWVLVCAPSLWRCYNILSLHFHLTFTCFCFWILSLTANATILQGSPRGWKDNKPVKAGSGGWVGVGGLNLDLGPRWIICFRGVSHRGTKGAHMRRPVRPGPGRVSSL